MALADRGNGLTQMSGGLGPEEDTANGAGYYYTMLSADTSAAQCQHDLMKAPTHFTTITPLQCVVRPPALPWGCV